METIDLHTTLVKREEVAGCEVGDELWMLDIVSEKYYGLDPIAARIWHLLVKPRQISEICEILMTEYEVAPATCEREVLAFARQLSDARLVHIVPA